MNHPASTNRPDFAPFSQTSHNHDPSKPEMFLGQITINNPDPFPNNPVDVQHFNSPRIRQPGQGTYNTNILRTPPLDFDADFPSAAEPVNQDIYEYTDKPKVKVTTHNPRRGEVSRNKPQNRINARPSYFNTPKHDEFESQRKPLTASNENYFSSSQNRFKPKGTTTMKPRPLTERANGFSPSTKSPGKPLAFNLRSNKPSFSPNKPHYSSTTEHKPLFDLESLLEDEIPEEHYGDSLRHPTNGSEDVEVIKSVEVTSKNPPTTEKDNLKLTDVTEDSTEEESSTHTILDSEISENVRNETVTEYPTETYIYEEQTEFNDPKEEERPENIVESNNIHTSEAPEYYDEEVEYVDDVEVEVPTKTKSAKTLELVEEHDEENEDYEEIEENPKDVPNNMPTVKSETFEILTMKPKQTMVKDDNFKEFVDSALIDNTEPPTYVTEEYVEEESPETTTEVVEEVITTESPSILIGEEVVSVVTTKSVVNGTFSVPEYTHSPPKTTADMKDSTEKSEINTKSEDDTKDEKLTTVSPNSTESWVVVASVQTSRSVSGARFLPFPGVAQDEKKQILSELDEEKLEEPAEPTKDPEEATVESVTVAELYTTDTNTKSTESIIDKLDQAQSELSSGFLSGGFKGGEQDYVVLTEMPQENHTKEEVTSVATPLQIFTVKSTSTTTEKPTPEPNPVTIKKFSPYSRPGTSTNKPKTKVPAFEEIKMDDLTGLLPHGFKVRPSFKDRKITTTTEKPARKEENQSRSLGNTSKNKVVIQDDLSSLLPKGYKPPKEEKVPSIEDIFKNIKTDNIVHLLPPGYKATPEASSTTKPKTKEPFDIASILPKGFKHLAPTTEKAKSVNKLLDSAKVVDISSFLPPGFKPTEQNATVPIKVADISSLLPPGFKLGNDPTKPKSSTQAPVSTVGILSTKAAPGKLVFPSRPGAGKPGKRLTTPKPSNEDMISGGMSTPSVLKKWPTR